ncbi:MAG: phosphoribosylamine--glycine ligase [Salinivirgaceae bacterium]|nr:phosphoribosylamine--glycine ligase [Salinivirgaceae bacterium]
MNVLVIGSGGREHAIAWKIAQSKRISQLFIAPGNAGTAAVGTNVAIKATDFEAIKKFVVDSKIDLVVVGPEEPLVKGIADFLANDATTKNVGVVGASAEGAQLEGSKEFAKQFMQRHGIPTAAYRSFTKETLADGQRFLETLKAPYVLKADGLAAGKGVLIINDLKEAQQSLAEMLDGQFGSASAKVVIEEFLSGIECSFFVLTDGRDYVLLPEAKDYKRIGEHDTGLNTGGMGAVSPVPFCTDEFKQKVITRIIEPTIKGLQADNIDYRGFIFFGLIKCGTDPYVIEYNVRMGDPETEVVIPRLDCDLLDLLEATAQRKLAGRKAAMKAETAITVVMVSGGYPESYKKGFEITGIENVTESTVFHAGTKPEGGRVLTDGGRVLAVTSLAGGIQPALDKSYRSIGNIKFDGAYFRRDIGQDLQNL